MNISQAGIFYECTENEQLIVEQIIPEHMLLHVYTGTVTIRTPVKTYTLSAGETALFSRNQLAKFDKQPDGDVPCNCATVFFNQSFLQKFYAGETVQKLPGKKPKVLQIAEHPLLNNLFDTVTLYANLNEAFVPRILASIKMHEAITVVRTLDKQVDVLLSNFSAPHKIDLSDFMEKNFMFNISITKFAYLTGRSLATFKRDFQETFGISPQKWLTEKRLEQAHFLIAEKHQRPSQAYVEAGFENFSHFTYAFKKFYGYTPSSVLSR